MTNKKTKSNSSVCCGSKYCRDDNSKAKKSKQPAKVDRDEQAAAIFRAWFEEHFDPKVTLALKLKYTANAEEPVLIAANLAELGYDPWDTAGSVDLLMGIGGEFAIGEMFIKRNRLTKFVVKALKSVLGCEMRDRIDGIVEELNGKIDDLVNKPSNTSAMGIYFLVERYRDKLQSVVNDRLLERFQCRDDEVSRRFYTALINAMEDSCEPEYYLDKEKRDAVCESIEKNLDLTDRSKDDEEEEPKHEPGDPYPMPDDSSTRFKADELPKRTLIYYTLPSGLKAPPLVPDIMKNIVTYGVNENHISHRPGIDQIRFTLMTMPDQSYNDLKDNLRRSIDRNIALDLITGLVIYKEDGHRESVPWDEIGDYVGPAKDDLVKFMRIINDYCEDQNLQDDIWTFLRDNPIHVSYSTRFDKTKGETEVKLQVNMDEKAVFVDHDRGDMTCMSNIANVSSFQRSECVAKAFYFIVKTMLVGIDVGSIKIDNLGVSLTFKDIDVVKIAENAMRGLVGDDITPNLGFNMSNVVYNEILMSIGTIGDHPNDMNYRGSVFVI